VPVALLLSGKLPLADLSFLQLMKWPVSRSKLVFTGNAHHESRTLRDLLVRAVGIAGNSTQGFKEKKCILQTIRFYPKINHR
jgi:hypothetical protein